MQQVSIAFGAALLGAVQDAFAGPGQASTGFITVLVVQASAAAVVVLLARRCGSEGQGSHTALSCAK